MDTLVQRLGELRLLPGDDRAATDPNGKAVTSSAHPEKTHSTIGTWVRGFGNGMRINDQVSRPYDQDAGGFQLGADKRIGALQGDLYLGGFLSYFNASRDFLDGSDGSTNAISVGTYSTWINPQGWYADLVLKYTQLWNYFRAPLSDGSVSTANYSIPAFGGSLEVGKRFDVGKFFIEPQAQLAGVWEAGNNYNASHGLTVDGSDQFSFRGRLGLRAGMHLAFSKEEAKVVAQPPTEPTAPWQISVGGPGWLAGVTGTSGFHGVNSDIDVDVGQILRHINVVYSLGAEVRRGRLGISGDLLYLNAQAGAAGTGLVSKVDLGLQQFLGELFGSWRVVEGPRGWLDVLAGFRFTYLGEQVGLQANNPAIDTASTQLVDRFAQQLTTPGSDLRTLVQQNVVNRLDSLLGRNPTLPVGPIAGRERGRIADLIREQLARRQPELAAAIRTGARARVNQLKAEIGNQVANSLTRQLNRSFSFYDDWFDPLIGLRGRFNLNKTFYLTAESDVGGFGIGSDIAVQAYAALGCQITRNIHSEVGYRYLYDEFRDESGGDFLYKMSLHGAQITVGLNF